MSNKPFSEAVRLHGDDWSRHVFPAHLLLWDRRDALVMKRCSNLIRRFGRKGSMNFRAVQWLGVAK